jgi:hypothetical protein
LAVIIFSAALYYMDLRTLEMGAAFLLTGYILYIILSHGRTKDQRGTTVQL